MNIDIENTSPKWKNTGMQTAIICSLAAIVLFLIHTNLLWEPIILFIISVFLLAPFRKESKFVNRLIILISILFIFWLVAYLGMVLLPFGIAFIVAYILDPFVSKLCKNKFPRWLASLIIVLGFIGLVTIIAVLVFPKVYLQLDDSIAQIKYFVNSVSSFFTSKKFYGFFESIGFREEAIRSISEDQLMPKLESSLTSVLESLLKFMTSISSIATQILNALLTPILTFYFLKDFRKFIEIIKTTIKKKDEKFFNDLSKINNIIRKYIGWQITASLIIASTCSFLFTIFGIPYPIVLGILCGFLNPIPYLGFLASMVICVLTVLMINTPELVSQVIIICSVISALHFINTYFLEPNIAGKRVGLHPLMVLGSLFVFGGLFGLIGLLFAVPATAAIIMFIKEWRANLMNKDLEENLVL